MNIQTAEIRADIRSRDLYLPGLDGLRFVAFLLVFIHHAGLPPEFWPLRALQTYGWVGVEIFFAISAFLFFHLLREEARQTGSISISKFFARRFLRIYPLMMGAPILGLLIYGAFKPDWFGRLLGLASFTDNILVAVLPAYNLSTPFSQHLWTLSAEFQIYLAIPLAFVFLRSEGQRSFLVALLIVSVVGLAARAALVISGARHPAIWVLVMLRPDSIIVGMLLSLGLFERARTSVVAAVAIGSAAVLVLGPNVREDGLHQITLFPLCGVLAGSLVWLAVYSPVVARVLGSPIPRFLGMISFGLYVFHVHSNYLAQKIVLTSPIGFLNVGVSPITWENYTIRIGLSLAITILTATASYFLFERYFLRLKDRFAVARGRA